MTTSPVGKVRTPRSAALATALGVAMALSGCGSREPPATPAVSPAPPADAATQRLTSTDATWTPEAMEELLAPIALYPDVVLGQVLTASTNPTEVLDAGNWLLQNQKLEGHALDQAAKQVGFTPPIRALLLSPEVIDMLCQQMSWTTQLGQAFVNDQPGVLGAVQRLRVQARNVGNLKSSEQIQVETKVEQDHQVIVISPPSPQVVYVPQYDPVAVYAPPAPTVPAAPAATGYSSEALVTTGLLAFGAGILIANAVDDDDDYYHGGYHPHYYGPSVPYRPPYPYRPTYGNGFYPGNGYRPPPNYQHRSNNTVVINQNNSYWNNFDKNVATRGAQSSDSPITARPNRSEQTALNAGTQGRAAAPPQSWRGQSTYAGAKLDAGSKVTSTQQSDYKYSGGYQPTGSTGRALPKIQGSYAGAAPNAANAAMPTSPTPRSASPAVSRPTMSAQFADADRGRAAPTAQTSATNRGTATAMSGANSGASERAASARGRRSMPNGVPSRTGR